MSDFIIKQGTDSGIAWPVKNASGANVNMVGWAGVCQIRAFNTNKLLHTFSTNNGSMILTTGLITLTWTSTETSTWNWNQARFGLEVTNLDGHVARIIQGIVTLSKEVTK